MKEVFRHWPELNARLQPMSKVLWLFDFDGTLTPLTKHPQISAMPMRVRELLRKLESRFPGHVGILSGRPLLQVRHKAGLRNLLYGGTHGFELQGPGLHYHHAVSKGWTQKLQDLTKALKKRSESIPGLWVEEKTWTRCIHYRETRKADDFKVRQYLRKTAIEATRIGFRIQKGIKTLELFVPDRWDKGLSTLRLKKFVNAKIVFYVGDDTTDESVFQVLTRSDVGVRVGRKRSSVADYYLRSQRHMAMLLSRLAEQL